jgi:hypothetical protein
MHSFFSSHLKFISLLLVGSILTIQISNVLAEESADQALDSCMRAAAIKGGAIGALVGGLLGALIAGKENRGAGAAVGAIGGGAVGGIAAWRSSWKTCSANFVAASSTLSANYNDTATRLGYDQRSVILKIEAAEMQNPIKSQSVLPINLQYVLLTPTAKAVPVLIQRRLVCMNESNVYDEANAIVANENLNSEPGTVTSKGQILIPKLPYGMSAQDCKMTVIVQAEGLRDTKEGQLIITP